MTDTMDAARNGQTPHKDPKATPAGGMGASPSPTPTAPPDGVPTYPERTKADIDLNHRLMVEEFIGWYYPGVRPALDLIVNEMIGIAWGVAKQDAQRPETADERRERLTGKGKP